MSDADPAVSMFLSGAGVAQGDADDLVAGAFPPPSVLSEGIEKKSFLPWHKPRKHYIRVNQWCKQVRGLITDLGLSPDLNPRPLRYMSLPGDELLDIRTLHGVCKRSKVLLQFLGYNAIGGAHERAAESDLSESEVKNLEAVYAQGSLVVRDSLEQITLVNSVAYRRAEERAPFDVINLDLCGSVAKQPPMTERGTMQAIKNILDLQQTRAEPWLFFLTTRVDGEVVDVGVQAEFHRRLISNSRSSAAFSASMLQQLGLSEASIARDIETREHLTHDRRARAFGLGFGKWLIANMGSRWAVHLLDSFGYQVGHLPMSMFSLAFRFSYIPEYREDPLGLTGSSGASKGGRFGVSSEEELALGMVPKIAELGDVDALLEEDAAMLTKVTKQARELLAQARHDPDAYDEWVLKGCP